MSESNQMTAVFSAVAQIPNTLGEINAMIQAGKSVVQVPAAVAGAMPSAAAAGIVGLGIELVIFLMKTAQAIEQDVDGVLGAMKTTQQTESDSAATARAAAAAFSTMAVA